MFRTEKSRMSRRIEMQNVLPDRAVRNFHPTLDRMIPAPIMNLNLGSDMSIRL